jgi:hypothetical protein
LGLLAVSHILKVLQHQSGGTFCRRGTCCKYTLQKTTV